MLTYLVISAVLAAAAITSESFPRKAGLLGVFCTLLLVLFAGLRFETGHDWLNYTGSYLDAPIFPEAIGQLLSHPLDVVFFLLTTAIKTGGLSVLAYLFLIAAISILPAHYVASKITRNVALVWAVVFGVVFLFSYMTLIRQTLATSFFLLALFWSIERKPLRSGATMVLALGIHVTTVAFAPVLLLTRWRPPIVLISVFLLSGVIVATGRINLLEVAAPLAVHLPTQVGLKLAIYAATQPSRITIGSLSLILFHIGVLAYLLYRAPLQDPWVNAAIWLTVLTLAAHLFFFGLPTVWNRLMIGSLPVEVAVVWRSMQKLPLPIRMSSILALSTFSAAALAYFLIKPTATPFTPYQFLPVVAASGQCGDGIERIVRAQELAVFVDAEKIPKELAAADPTTHFVPPAWSRVKDLVHSSYGFCAE